MNQVDEETEEVTMTLVRGHSERVVFDVIPIGHHQVILGSPWLKTHNPTIDWWNHTIRMNGCRCIAVTLPKLNRENATLGQGNELCVATQELDDEA